MKHLILIAICIVENPHYYITDKTLFSFLLPTFNVNKQYIKIQ
jgi:hypothetical protein